MHARIHKRDWNGFFRCGLGLLFAASATGSTRAAGYRAVDLYTLGTPIGITSPAPGTTVSGSRVLGHGTALDGNLHALVWDSLGVATDLNPANLGITQSILTGGIAAQQVGYGSGAVTGGFSHALLWNGAAIATDLHPTNIDLTQSFARGTDGVHQVGYGSGNATNGVNHALWWNGSNSSAVDLNPTNLTGISVSSASDVYGNLVVGYGAGSGTNFNVHALLWNGTSNSAVDLNPTNIAISFSVASHISGSQEVGYGYGVGTNGITHALLWRGSSTVTDLNPTNLSGITQSVATATNGIQQVGYGGGHALLWNSTSTAIDLQALLPANFDSSSAWSIDSAGNIFGTATDLAGNTDLIEWIAQTPEPASCAVLGLGSLTLLRRTRRNTRSRNAA